MQQGGIRHFFVGTAATVQRDLVFGGTFAVLRHEIIPYIYFHHILSSEKGNLKAKRQSNSSSTGNTVLKTDFFINVVSGMIATLLSSPINYVRNIHYATGPNERIKSSFEILRELYRDAKNEASIIDCFVLLQRRLRLGWGTARVGVGMAFGAKIYELCAAVIH